MSSTNILDWEKLVMIPQSGYVSIHGEGVNTEILLAGLCFLLNRVNQYQVAAAFSNLPPVEREIMVASVTSIARKLFPDEATRHSKLGDFLASMEHVRRELAFKSVKAA